MALCSSSDTNTNAKLYWGQQGDLELTITRAASSTVSLEDAQLEFTVGQTYATPIQTVPAPQITLTTNTASQLVATFSVDEGLISAALGTPGTYTLVWQVEITAVSGAIATLQGQITLENAFAAEGSIVVPETIDQNTIVTYATIDPRRFDTDGQIPKWNNDTQTFDPGTDEGGVGSGVSSVNGQTGAVTLTTSNINEGTNLYYTDTRVETVLGAAIATDFSAAVQASLGLADSALQPGDAIPQSDVTNLTTDLAAKANATITLTAGTGIDGGGNLTANRSFALNAATLTSLALADSALQADDIGVSVQAYDAVHDQLAALTVANGQVIGWVGGALGNISISGGGDMLKSVYDSNDDGVIDVGAIPDLSGTYLTAVALGYTAAPTQGTVTNDAGANAVIPAADVTNAGLLLPAEKASIASALQPAALSGYQLEPSEGAFVDGDKTKLDGIEAGATADQTGAEIKSAYEAEANTNAFTDAEQSKLAGIEAGAEANNISDANATDLTDGGDTILHTHDGRYYTETETDGLLAGKEPTITATTAADYYRGDKSFQPLNKAAVGLGNVDNTSDLQSPLETTTNTKVTLGATWVDTGLSQAITPTTATRKVKITATIPYRVTGGRLAFRLVRDSTTTFDPNGDTTNPFIVLDAGTTNSVYSLVKLDAPATTSAVTYKIQARSTGAGTVEVCPDAGGSPATTALMLLEETY